MRKILIFILCFCTIFLCFGIPSFASESVTSVASSRAVPTDLTGVTVSVPDGWSVPGPSSFFVDYYADWYDNSTSLCSELRFSSLYQYLDFYSGDSRLARIYPDTPFSLRITGGVDADTSALIQWFVDNNATFIGGTPSVPEISSISAGVYHFKSFGNLPDIPDASWSDGTGYTYSYTLAGKYATTSRTIPFTALNLTFDEYVSASHYTVTFSVDTNDGIVNLATYSASYGNIDLEQRSDFKYLIFDDDLIGSYDDIEFIRHFLSSGFPDTDTSAVDNPWAYILEMIIEALQVDLFGYFSVWDIFTTVCGIFIVTWLLKLLAGG